MVEDGEDEPIYPSKELVDMEIKANEVFARYAKMYYDSDFITTVLFFDQEGIDGFGSCWLVKKSKYFLQIHS